MSDLHDEDCNISKFVALRVRLLCGLSHMRQSELVNCNDLKQISYAAPTDSVIFIALKQFTVSC